MIQHQRPETSPDLASGTDPYVVVGQVMGVFGVKGALKIKSETSPLDQIVNYQPWFLRLDSSPRIPVEPQRAQSYRKGLLVELKGYSDPDAVRPFVGAWIEVTRSSFRPLPNNQYYWTDLIHLTVETEAGQILGRVDHLIDNGAQDLLVVRAKGEKDRLIPFIQGPIVKTVDLTNRRLVIDSTWEF